MNGYGPSEEQMNKMAMMSQMRQQPPPPPAGGPGPVSSANTGVVGPKPADGPYQAKGPAMGLEGFDAGKLADTTHNSPKYVFARAAQGLGMGDKDELLKRLKADPNGYFANASFGGSKGDKLQIGGQLDPSFDGINEFDVVRGAGDGGKGWQWGVDSPGGGGAPHGGGGSGSMVNGGMSQGMAQMLTSPSYYQQLMKKLQGDAGPESTDPNALRALMMQQ